MIIEITGLPLAKMKKTSRRKFIRKTAGLTLVSTSTALLGLDGNRLKDSFYTNTEGLSGEKSPITNNWGKVKGKKIRTEHSYIHKGDEQAAYHHHHQITSLNGRLYASFSQGFKDEDQLGQRGMFATSDDLGGTWSKARPFIDRQPGRREHGVVTPEGIHVHNGRLIGYYGYIDLSRLGLMMYYATGGNGHFYYMSERSYQNTHTGIMVSDDEGKTWVNTGQKIDRFFPNLGPFKTSRGRLILPGNVSFCYTDDPYGIEGWTKVDLPGLSDNFIDDPNGIRFAGEELNLGYEVMEGSGYELDDGTLHMMLRTNKRTLAVSESKDHGESWSTPKMTSYTDCNCRFHFGRLPDGRYFGLNCPDPDSVRTPMILATSNDGFNFDQHYILGDEPYTLFRVPGNHKYGRYGYPYVYFLKDTAYAIYSVNKEDIGLCRFKLSELSQP